MRRCVFGGSVSARCSPQRFDENGQISFVSGTSGNGIWTRPLPGPSSPDFDPLRSKPPCGTGSEVVKINGETHYLWRAVDHEGEVLEAYVIKRRDRHAALKFLRKAMKRYGNPEVVVTDRLKSYRAAMKTIGNEAKQDVGRWLNNRAENSHLPFRRRERAMLRFRRMRSLQKFVAVHSSHSFARPRGRAAAGAAGHNPFNLERHLCDRNWFKENRKNALAEWRQLAA